MQKPNIKFERKAFVDGFDIVLGCDEVGRGPIAGPVVACACAFDKDFFGIDRIIGGKYEWSKFVRDSKTLTAKKREELAPLIKENCLAYSIAQISEAEIDKINIHQAVLRAMQEATQEVIKKIYQAGQAGLRERENFPGGAAFIAFFDGKFAPSILDLEPRVKLKTQAVVGGDAKIFSIAAASIIAKVYRDDLMKKHHQALPEYGFAKHKGYGTKEHFAAIIKHGLSPIHRRSFIKI